MEEREVRDADGDVAVPGPSLFPSGDPGVSGDFWVGCRLWGRTESDTTEAT